MRAALLTLHKYAGLVLGVLLSVIGLTGSVLVFDHALDELIAPATVAFEDSGERAPLETVLDSATAALGTQAAPYRIYIARKPGSPHVVRFRNPAVPPAGPIEVSVSPVDGRVLAVRTWGEYTMTWIYHLHYALLSGASGKLVVGVLGLAMLFFCISGLIIWWPRPGRWRRALTIDRHRGAFRLNFDIHKTAGVYLLPVLAAVSFSGVEIVFPRQVAALVDAVATINPEPAPESTPAARSVTVDTAVETGQRVFADAKLKRVHLPSGDRGTYLLLFNQPGEPWESFAASRVWVDRYSGEVLAVSDPLEASAGSAFLTWQFPIHNGDALGLPGRWIVFVSGFLPALLFVTGVYMWWRKRRVRRLGSRRGRTATRTEPIPAMGLQTREPAPRGRLGVRDSLP